MRYLQYILMLLVLVVATSCLDENSFTRTIDVVPTVPKVVVYGFLNPEEDSIHIYVSKSLTINSSTQYSEEQLADAQVSLKKGDTEVQVPWRGAYSTVDTNLMYTYAPGGFKMATRDFPMSPGDVIQLKVVTSIGTVTSSCVIPDENQLNASMGKVRIATSDNELTADVVFNGFPAGDANYHVFAEVSSFDLEYKRTYNTYELLPEAAEKYFVHKTNDPAELKYRFKGSYYSYESENKSDSIVIYSAKTDDNYYKYHTSYEYFKNAEDNPFSEPVALFSNIKGGLGVFSAYHKKRYAFAVKDYLN